MKPRRFLAFRAERFLHVVFPIVLQQFGMLGGLHVQRDHLRRKPRSKFNSLPRDVAPAVDRNHRDRMSGSGPPRLRGSCTR